MDNFTKAIQFVFPHEGGYANNPNDRGGETYMGIARKYWPTWEGWKIIDEVKEKYSPFSRDFKEELLSKNIYQKVVDFYKKNHWETLLLDKVNSDRISSKILDMAINLGISRAASLVQICLNLISGHELKIDNIVGNKTITLLNFLIDKGEAEFLLKLLTLQQGYIYMKICQLNDSQEQFIHSWINRLHMKIEEF